MPDQEPALPVDTLKWKEVLTHMPPAKKTTTKKAAAKPAKKAPAKKAAAKKK